MSTQKWTKLKGLLLKMVVPYEVLETKDISWLRKHLWVRNANHPDLNLAMKLIREILEKQNGK